MATMSTKVVTASFDPSKKSSPSSFAGIITIKAANTHNNIMDSQSFNIIVPPENRNQYGLGHTISIIATNNPKASLFGSSIDPTTRYPPRKLPSVCANAEFAGCWKQDLGPAILSTLENFLTSFSYCLSTLRFGFRPRHGHHDNGNDPIVIQLVIRDPKIEVGDDLASELLTAIEAHVRTYWEDKEEKCEKVSIDICKLEHARSSSPNDTAGLDQSMTFPALYEQLLPLPGSSLGVDEISGTVTGYLKHQLPDGTFEVFLATCQHVADLHNTIAHAGLVQEGDPIITMSFPSPEDHEVTKMAIKGRARRTENAFWLKAQHDAENCNIELGKVSATSGNRNFDWALIQVENVTDPSDLNKHFPFNKMHCDSGFQCPPFAGFPEAKVIAAEKYFRDGPPFLTIRQTALTNKDVCFKQPSRTTREWMGVYVNDIESITKTSPGSTPKTQYCLVSAIPSHRSAGSRSGDSGSIIFDCDFYPAAVMWGGHDAMGTSIPDVTLATPLLEILADIEKTLGWEKGSVLFC